MRVKIYQQAAAENKEAQAARRRGEISREEAQAAQAKVSQLYDNLTEDDCVEIWGRSSGRANGQPRRP
jgi:hypothetical protein